MSDHPPHMQSRPRDCPECVKLLKPKPRQQHLSECFLAMFPQEPTAYCTCMDWSPDA